MNVELLAPGGSLDSVKAAINAGADAVYTGGTMFGAREYADNLNTEQMIEALQYAHIHGRKIYLTVNTLLKDREIEESLYNYLLPFYENGLDAVIVQDLGVMKFIHDKFPDMPIHASTQMTIMGDKTAKYLLEYGVTRIVTPRELGLNEIRNIYDNTQMEIESFVHGALCYCYSGQCFLSSYIGGRSGNRGKCAQPCRLNYDVIKEGRIINLGDNKYVLSPKDICTLKILPDIIEAGVSSLKIEGRMKKTEYTAGITSLYRKYIDMYLEKGKKGYSVSDTDIQKAMDLFNRNGFNESYYKMHNGKEMISLKKPTFRMENTQLVKNIRDNVIDVEPKEKINIYINILKDCNVNMVVTYKDLCVEVSGSVPMPAQKAPLTEDIIKKQLSKLGNTSFVADYIEVTLDDRLFLTMGEINALRREMVEKLTEHIINQSIRGNVPKATNENAQCIDSENENIVCRQHNKPLDFSVLVSNRNQLEVVTKCDSVSRIYIEAYSVKGEHVKALQNMLISKKAQLYLALPHVFRMKDEKKITEQFGDYLGLFDGFLVRNIEGYFYLVKNKITNHIILDYNAYTFNKYSKQLVNEINESVQTTVPVELNYRELDIRGCADEEIVVYGYMPVMISANCVAKTCDVCTKKSERFELKDRLSQNMNVQCVCDYCYNIIYNSKPLSLLKFSKEIKGLKVNSIRMEFTTESNKVIGEILTKFEKTYFYNEDNIEDVVESTRGHFKRGVK